MVKTVGEAKPSLFDDGAKVAEDNLVILDHTKEAFSVLGAKGDKVGSGLAIVVSRQSQRSTMVNIGVVLLAHGSRCSDGGGCARGGLLGGDLSGGVYRVGVNRAGFIG